MSSSVPAFLKAFKTLTCVKLYCTNIFLINIIFFFTKWIQHNPNFSNRGQNWQKTFINYITSRCQEISTKLSINSGHPLNFSETTQNFKKLKIMNLRGINYVWHKKKKCFLEFHYLVPQIQLYQYTVLRI